MPHRQLIDALFVPGIDLLGGLQYRRHLRLGQVAVLSQLPQNFHIVSHSVVSPPSCKDRRGNLSAPVSLFTKASQSSRPQTRKIGIIFHRDMRVGKNISQAASVEFCPCGKIMRAADCKPFGKKIGDFCQIQKSPQLLSRGLFCVFVRREREKSLMERFLCMLL